MSGYTSEEFERIVDIEEDRPGQRERAASDTLSC